MYQDIMSNQYNWWIILSLSMKMNIKDYLKLIYRFGGTCTKIGTIEFNCSARYINIDVSECIKTLRTETSQFLI